MLFSYVWLVLLVESLLASAITCILSFSTKLERAVVLSIVLTSSKKRATIHFYCFPDDPKRRAKWIAAVRRNHWVPNEHSWLCSEYFVSRQKILSPDYVPSSVTCQAQQRENKLKTCTDMRDWLFGKGKGMKTVTDKLLLTVSLHCLRKATDLVMAGIK